MAERKGNGGRERASSSDGFVAQGSSASSESNDAAVTSILDERIQNLREAIEEIDIALANREQLSQRFIDEIECETDEVKRHLGMLNPPWKTGFYPELEFLRLSFHKSITSRSKERRTEKLKYWENGVNLAKERRKFLDEYKALLATKRRLDGA